MQRTHTVHAATLALATLLTGAMLLVTSTLANHQYRVAASAPATSMPLARSA